MTATAEDILDFWFSEESAQRWFRSTPEFDQEIRERFESTWMAAAQGRLDGWRETPSSTLALVILLDQFPLNMYRDEAKSFATESRAIAVSREALDKGFDKRLAGAQLSFLYLPFMHSERLADQELSVSLFAQAGLENNLRFARHHREIIKRFGRFPHRNRLLGRRSTAEEEAYLESPEAFKG